MAYKTLIFGVDSLYPKLKPFYDREVQRGTLEIVEHAVIDKKGIHLVENASGGELNSAEFQLAIISSKNDFYRRMKLLEERGFTRDQIIDGRVFNVPNLDFPRLLKEGVAHGVINKKSFVLKSYTIYPQVYTTKNGKMTLSLGSKSYIRGGTFEVTGSIVVKNFSYLATNIFFSIGENYTHNHLNVGMISQSDLDWKLPKEFLPPQGECKIVIGNDVWIGRGVVLKCTNPNKPLVIGNGAVIASDSVVVKNVPPYAIVGGNPAQIIKYRFPEHVIKALLRIKWWDWSLDKIHDNFKYFNDVEKFIALHDN